MFTLLSDADAGAGIQGDFDSIDLTQEGPGPMRCKCTINLCRIVKQGPTR